MIPKQLKGVKDSTILGLKKIKRRLKRNNKFIGIAIVLNSVFAIFLGAYIDNIKPCNFSRFDFSDCSFFWTFFTIFIFILYVAFTWWLYENSDSEKIEFLDRIIYKEEKDKQEELNIILTQGLENLSSRTCETFLCTTICDENKLEERLAAITEPLKNSYSKIIGSSFSIGVYIHDTIEFTKPNSDLHNKCCFLILHDDLGISNKIDKELMNKNLSELTGFNKFLYYNINNTTFDNNYNYIEEVTDLTQVKN